MERLVSANTSAYAAAGVNIDNKMTALKAIKAMVGSTKTANVAGGIGSFGGLCRLPAGLKDPILADGIVFLHHAGDLELCADSVRGCHQHRVFQPGG